MASLRIKSVLLLDGVDKVCSEILTDAGLSVTTVNGKLSKEELLQKVASHSVIVVRSATKVTAEVLDAGLPTLQLVGRAGTGTDNIDTAAATQRGILVMNTPGGNTVSAAEHTCSLICSLGRFLPQACASMKSGAWDRKAFMGNELYGKTLAIVGLGRIGKEVATRMQAFGMKIIAYDPFVSTAQGAELDIEMLELEQIWPKADYITVHTPLLPHTKNLVGEKVLQEKCKAGVKIINVARGGIVDEEALLKALNNGRCGGAALDVFVNEPPTDLSLISHPKVVCTPHLGASTAEAQRRVAVEIADQIVAASRGQKLNGLVNAAGLSLAGGAVAKPWVELATALGQLAAHMLPNSVKDSTVDLRCCGSSLEPLNKALGLGLLTGLLKSETNGRTAVNLVNAAMVAEDHKLTLQSGNIEESNRDPLVPALIKEYIEVVLKKGEKSVKLVGCLSNNKPLLLSIDESRWECGFPLYKQLMVCRSKDAQNPIMNRIYQMTCDEKIVVNSLSKSDDSMYYAAQCETHKKLFGNPSQYFEVVADVQV